MADATLIAAIRKAASQTGANPVLLVATSLVESGATWYPTPGDNDTSFGPFQFHIGGALGSNPPAWASTYAAVLNRAEAFVGAATGADAARIQGPTDPNTYAAKVNAEIPAARQLLAQVPASTPATPTALNAPDPGAAAATIVQTQLGVKYSWDGGTLAGPSLGTAQGAGTVGFDCSGLVLWVYGQLGLILPHFTGAQWQLGVPVAQSDLQPGDVVFFDPDANGTPQHEGLYIGSGKFTEAPQTGDVVKTETLASHGNYVGARRYVAPSTVQRNGTLIPAATGRLLPADTTSLDANWKAAVAKIGKGGSSFLGGLGIGSPGSTFGIGITSGSNTGVSTVGSLNPVGGVEGAISDAVSSLESAAGAGVAAAENKLVHGAMWLLLAGAGLGLIYMGLHRAIAPDSHPIAAAAKAAGAAA